MIVFDTLSQLESYQGAFPEIGTIIGVMDRSLPYDQGPGRYDTPEESSVRYIIDEGLTSDKGFIAEPFSGMKIAMSIHLEAKTAYLATVLKNGGAEVFATGCNPLSTQDDVAAALCEYGVHVYAVHGDDEDTYVARLEKTLSCKPDLIIDDGGDFISLLHGKSKHLGENLIGGCEETTTGIHRLRQS